MLKKGTKWRSQLGLNIAISYAEQSDCLGVTIYALGRGATTNGGSNSFQSSNIDTNCMFTIIALLN